MTTLIWDAPGEHKYETGIDHGVLYTANNLGVYTNGFAWNGLTGVTESPSGGEANPMYADNIKYLNLISVEQFGGTIEAYTYPPEFAQFDGLSLPIPGVAVGQQPRKPFGLSYRTRMGDELEGDSLGYKIHVVYNATAAPSEKAYTTVNESPEAITFSWTIETTPVPVPNARPTALITITSTEVDAGALADFEEILYGTSITNPRLPFPAEILAIFGATVTLVTPTAPTLSGGVNLAIPTVTGVVYSIAGEVVTGTVVLADDETVLVEATLALGAYSFAAGPLDTDWLFTGVV